MSNFFKKGSTFVKASLLAGGMLIAGDGQATENAAPEETFEQTQGEDPLLTQLKKRAFEIYKANGSKLDVANNFTHYLAKALVEENKAITDKIAKNPGKAMEYAQELQKLNTANSNFLMQPGFDLEKETQKWLKENGAAPVTTGLKKPEASQSDAKDEARLQKVVDRALKDSKEITSKSLQDALDAIGKEYNENLQAKLKNGGSGAVIKQAQAEGVELGEVKRVVDKMRTDPNTNWIAENDKFQKTPPVKTGPGADAQVDSDLLLWIKRRAMNDGKTLNVNTVTTAYDVLRNEEKAKFEATEKDLKGRIEKNPNDKLSKTELQVAQDKWKKLQEDMERVTSTYVSKPGIDWKAEVDGMKKAPKPGQKATM